jgi:cysteine synthase A
MSSLRPDVSKTIGSTALVRLNRVSDTAGAEILAKLELQNPLGSVKDRIAAAMLDDAEQSGRLHPGGAVVEPTSGNTGIALAGICAARGYKLFLTMPESMSLERRRLLAHLGADIRLSEASGGMRGAVDEAHRLLQEDPAAVMLDQFSNPANPAVHSQTTAEEIWTDCRGRVDAVVVGVGTGGTLSGVATKLKSRNPSLRAVAVEPASSPILSGGRPGKHAIQGIGAGFVPENLAFDLVDEVLQVTDEQAIATARDLAAQEGLLVGISSGAAVRAAWELASRQANRGATIVTVLPDTAERYMSTDLFRSDKH